MVISEIITLIISSSVLSAFLTGFVNLRIQNLNFKSEYYKKLIERRIDAQEQILSLTNELRIQVCINPCCGISRCSKSNIKAVVLTVN
jgi:hypothetical protein